MDKHNVSDQMNAANGNENIGANEFLVLSHNKPMRIINISQA